MTPEQNVNIANLEYEVQPTRTYRLDLQNKRISGIVDGEEAMLQAIIKLLQTERYANVIYSSRYGVELERFIGKDYNFIVSDLERTITAALIVDDRIIRVSNFSVEKTGLNELTAVFTVETVYGNINVKTEVSI